MRTLLLGLLGLFACAGVAQAITLEQAMADPDWIGPPVEASYWSVDGTALYYSLKQAGSPVRDLHRIELASGADAIVDPAAMAHADGADAVFDHAGTRAAFVRNGDLFLRELGTGRLRQVTKTPEPEASPRFAPDGSRLVWRQGSQWFVHDIATGVSGPAAILEAGKDPQEKKANDLEELQLRYFATLRQMKADREAQRTDNEAFTKGDPTRTPLPFHLGDDVRIVGTSLSPDARWMLVVTAPKAWDAGRRGKLQHFVTESGYEEQEDERVRVGRNAPAPQSLVLLDLAGHTIHPLAFDALPGIHDDPLAEVRAENERAKAQAEGGDKPAKPARAKARAKKPAEEPKERALRIFSWAEDGGGGGIRWSDDGREVAVQLRAIDNKDRWIASVDLAAKKLVPRHRLTDPAWINWNFNDFGWLADNRTLWYLSEESGWSTLYTQAPGAKPKALTPGEFEASEPALSRDGKWFYYRANAQASYRYDLWRVAASGDGKPEQLTTLGAVEAFHLAPDGTRVALQHSSSRVPTQLAVLEPGAGSGPRTLTDTRTAEYKALAWPELEIVAVPSSHTRAPIYAKLYKPRDFDPAKRYPAVLFVHGAGYLQNVHLGFPSYFREQMFHDLLTQEGYVVLDMDYRASEGYGRDWRTAIYRNMGHPELEDLIDGVDWLVAHVAVDRERVGLYGGSYGGFMTLMAMFRAPEVFKAGAALRPVTDWTQYNHEYTSNILNTPQVDAIAYRRSSPMEFAEGLRGALLVAHGMIDNNVLYEDSVRLQQKLIELRKTNYDVVGYPMERHGFVHADSWWDEYRRIHELFEANLKR